ncbi:MAG: hypothetical protein LC792_15245 [Actinobacteria bacterium]|nr:hypothetical protein [Actinomycetota bacterium]
MDWAGWAVFGLLATTLLTAVMITAQLVGLTRMDIPLLLGTIFVQEPDRARVVGFFVHLVNGQAFALFYAAAFAVRQRAGVAAGAGLGVAHGLVALTVIVPMLPAVHPHMASERSGPELVGPALEPPGLFGRNYGRETAVVTMLAHVAYGALLGLLLHPHH